MADKLAVAIGTVNYWFRRSGFSADRHRRGMHPVFSIYIDGQTMTVPEACRKYGLRSRTIYYRLGKGERGPEVVRPAKRTGRPKGGRK